MIMYLYWLLQNWLVFYFNPFDGRRPLKQASQSDSCTLSITLGFQTEYLELSVNFVQSPGVCCLLFAIRVINIHGYWKELTTTQFDLGNYVHSTLFVDVRSVLTKPWNINTMPAMCESSCACCHCRCWSCPLLVLLLLGIAVGHSPASSPAQNLQTAKRQANSVFLKLTISSLESFGSVDLSRYPRVWGGAHLDWF